MKNRKYFLVTGATGSIGKGLIKKILTKKDNFVFGIGRNWSELDHKNLYKFSVDLSEENSMEYVFDHLLKNKIKLDFLICCHGVDSTLALKQINYTITEKLFKVNVFSTINIVKYFSLKKHSNDYSSIVILSSISSIKGYMGKSLYSSTKSALTGFVKSSALELSKRKIQINLISPGIIKNKMGERNLININSTDYPLGLINVLDVVYMIEFLISNKSNLLTGQNIIIDSGESI